MFQQYPYWSRSVRLTSLCFVAATSLCVLPAPVHAEVFSLICMPDPQFYTTQSQYDLYRKQTNWIKNNKTAYNIKHVLWLGDLTNDNTASQWTTANNAYNILDNANISYGVVPGNHDYKTSNADKWIGANLRDLSRYNGTVGPGRFSSKPWYGGNMGNTTTNNENNYTFFSAGGMDFLAIGLETLPRKETITWANNLISQYPNHRVIIYTHSYLTTSGAYGSGGAATATVGASGSELWNECASRHSNVFLVVCGHVTESVTNTRTGVNGNTVYEMLVDYQGEKALGAGADVGNGWLRIMQFDTATNKISCSTISADSGNPALFTDGIDKFYLTSKYSANPLGADHLFTKNYNMNTPIEYSYVNGSSNFHVMSAGKDLTADQIDPVIAQQPNGDWVTAWADDNDKNGIYRIMVRGFDADGNERFAPVVANTSGVNVSNVTKPTVAMIPDGRFVVVWQSGSTSIRGRAFNADGTPAAGEQIMVLTSNPGSVTRPRMAMAASGNYVITWNGDLDGDGLNEVFARGFQFPYSQTFPSKVVNTVTTGQQRNPEISMNSVGNYVIVWEDDADNDGLFEIGMRGFNANETQKFSQAFANSTVVGQEQNPDVAVDETGKFVVIWEDDSDGNGAYQVRASGKNADGSPLFSERTVNVNSSGNQINPAVDIDEAGNWYPVWEDNSIAAGYQMFTNKWTIAGDRVNASDSRANSITAVTHKFGPEMRMNPDISVHKSGRTLVAWADDMDGDGNYQPLVCGLSGNALTLAVKAVHGSIARTPDEPYFAQGSSVTITAVPDPGYVFQKWLGDVPAGNTTTNPLQLFMSASKNLTAQFVVSSRVGNWELY